MTISTSSNSKTKIYLSIAGIVSVWIIAAAIYFWPSNKNTNLLQGISSEISEVFKEVSPAVVRVESQYPNSTPIRGTGFFIDSDGTLLTSYAVVGLANTVFVDYNKHRYTAKVLGRDARSGIALLKIDVDGSTPYLKQGDSDHLALSASVILVAYPYNLPVNANFGFISGFETRYLNKFFATTHFASSIEMSPGQIGGPLVDGKGKVVGIAMLGVDQGKLCYSIPIKAAIKIADDIKEKGHAVHGWVGVGAQEMTTPDNTISVMKVSYLFEGTPAATSGVQPGDIIKSINGRLVRIPADILDVSFFSKVGSDVPVVVVRNGKEMNFSIKIIERPEASAIVQKYQSQTTQIASGNKISPQQVIPVKGTN
jgi:serine protease Do